MCLAVSGLFSGFWLVGLLGVVAYWLRGILLLWFWRCWYLVCGILFGSVWLGFSLCGLSGLLARSFCLWLCWKSLAVLVLRKWLDFSLNPWFKGSENRLYDFLSGIVPCIRVAKRYNVEYCVILWRKRKESAVCGCTPETLDLLTGLWFASIKVCSAVFGWLMHFYELVLRFSAYRVTSFNDGNHPPCRLRCFLWSPGRLFLFFGGGFLYLEC